MSWVVCEDLEVGVHVCECVCVKEDETRDYFLRLRFASWMALFEMKSAFLSGTNESCLIPPCRLWSFLCDVFL